ncbi:MAG: winged helix-turn-helix transcriptional regulator [Candidatus Cloacimonetes bacterium]|nr:winged helix-turn-helix transcriptional regulator [Candidatus Cloacimonadota bacterium]
MFNNGPKSDPNEPNNEPKKPQNKPKNEPKKYHDEPKNEPKDDIERIVVELLIANPKSSYTDMISATGKSRTTIKRLLDSLKEKGIIERVGPKNGGKWIVK